jgi:zinc/manganese transport system substrate-binding protein
MLRAEFITVIIFINGGEDLTQPAAIQTGDRNYMLTLRPGPVQPPRPRTILLMVAAFATAALAAACSSASPAANSSSTITAVGAENEYANVISQVGGKYAHVSAIESNPNTDPHTFEASASVAQLISSAGLVVQNGLGYDTYMNKIEAAAPNAGRKVIDVQHLLGLPDSTPNPHLWYKPTTMPAVAKAVAADLSSLQPAHKAYFAAHAAAFDRSLHPWYHMLAAFKARYPGTPVATTEPVGDYLLQAAGTRNLTPFAFQADVMNGVDPAPQYVSLQNGLFSGHKVKVFLYNQQVTDSLTASFLAAAHKDGIAVVGVYETMPEPGYDYQSWMMAETTALERAVEHGISTERLK